MNAAQPRPTWETKKTTPFEIQMQDLDNIARMREMAKTESKACIAIGANFGVSDLRISVKDRSAAKERALEVIRANPDIDGDGIAEIMQVSSNRARMLARALYATGQITRWRDADRRYRFEVAE